MSNKLIQWKTYAPANNAPIISAKVDKYSIEIVVDWVTKDFMWMIRSGSTVIRSGKQKQIIMAKYVAESNLVKVMKDNEDR